MYQLEIAPSYAEMERILGTPFWVDIPVNVFGSRDHLLCEEYNSTGPVDFWFMGNGYTGSAILHGLQEYMIPCAPFASVEDLRTLVSFNEG